MFKAKFDLNKWKQRGQALVLYALMLPTAFIGLGVAADFGWWYLNVSRLQNAADAAVIAGANQFIYTDYKGSDYTYSTFVDKVESTLIEKNIISTRDTRDGDLVAATYAGLNLSDKAVEYEPNSEPSKDIYKIFDSWNNDSEVIMTRKMYGTDKDDWDALYYTITLEGKANHLFGIMEQFGNMNVKAVAVAKLTHIMPSINAEHGVSLYQQMLDKEKLKTYKTWDHIKHEYDLKLAKGEDFSYLGVGTATDNAARTRSVQSNENWYVKGNKYRTETLKLNGITGGKYKINQLAYDDLFIDFKVDVQYSFKKDWDLGSTDPDPKNVSYNLQHGDGLNGGSTKIWHDQFAYRIHDIINVDITYPVRASQGKEPPDPLYARIEGEDINNDTDVGQNTSSWNTVRQIIINVNVANTNVNKDRPIIFIYEGPEKIEGKEIDSETGVEKYKSAWKDPTATNVRDSLPVILNLNADFRGILFMPNSPVVINGNGHKFEGFIVAKKYLKLKTEEDFNNTDKYESSKNSNNDKIIFDKNEAIDKNDLPSDKLQIIDSENNILIADESNIQYLDTSAYTLVSRNDQSSNSLMYINNGTGTAGYETYIWIRNETNEKIREIYVKKNAEKFLHDSSQSDDQNKRNYGITNQNPYKLKDSNGVIWWVRKNDTLFSQDGWYGVYDENNNLLVVKKTDVKTINNVQPFKDSNGQTAYVNLSDIEEKYLNVKENKYINENTSVYYTVVTQEQIDGTNDYSIINPPIIIDNKGNVQYRDDEIEVTIYDENSRANDPQHGEEKFFDKNDFNLSQSIYNSYLQVGLVNYTYLNAPNAIDNIFTTERSDWID
ncbi:MAG: hypothetical protein IJ728_13040 [Selenomonadaceae bacterium]|nr:hypothetical protein [Selenomonadaceae bacterium]